MRERLAVVGVWALVALVVDQLAKWGVRLGIDPGESVALIGQVVRLTHVTNTGAAFGLFSGQTALFVAATAAVITMAVLLASRLRFSDQAALAGLGLASGGAAGNLADRLRLGAVVDFIDVGAWPVFNLADAAIVTGVGLLMWHLVRAPRRAGVRASPPAQP